MFSYCFPHYQKPIEDVDLISCFSKLFPVPYVTDPCNSQSFGSRYGRTEGRLNPCGGGTCQVTGPNSYNCTCAPPFVVGTNVDGTQACIPSELIIFFQKNLNFLPSFCTFFFLIIDPNLELVLQVLLVLLHL